MVLLKLSSTHRRVSEAVYSEDADKRRHTGRSRTGCYQRRDRLSSAPHTSSCFRHKLQLGPLFVFGKQISFHRRGETALWAQSEVLERNVPRRFVNSLHELITPLELRPLGANEPQHDDLAFLDQTQRLNRSRARVVVLEQEAIDRQGREELLRNGVVAAFSVPMATVVASAKMHRQYNARASRRVEARVVCTDRFVEQMIRCTLHVGASSVPPLLIDELAVTWRVDLNVGHTLGRESGKFLFHDPHDVPQQGGMVLIHLVCDPALE